MIGEETPFQFFFSVLKKLLDIQYYMAYSISNENAIRHIIL